jgi:hypothetical protein
MTTIDDKVAKARGYEPLTHRYRLPKEQAMLDNVLADMRRGNIDYVVVRENGGVAVWRSSGRRTARTASMRRAA